MGKQVEVQNIIIGGGGPLAVIAGPCVLESREVVFRVAEKLKEVTDRLKVPFIFKSSYDKANRSSINSYRGPGISDGLKLLDEVKKEFGIPIITDIHTVAEAEQAAQVVDVIQIPAFLCRQTDIIIAAARTNKPINVKKGQFLAPGDVKNIIEKIESVGARNIMVTERGTSFGYNNLIVDMRSLVIMKEFGYPVIFDATHSVQYPGGGGTFTGGDSRFVPVLARAATAVGIDALFMEVHPDPENALCDGPNSINLKDMPELLREIVILDAISKRKIKIEEVEKLRRYE